MPIKSVIPKWNWTRNKTETRLKLPVPTYLPNEAKADIAEKVIKFIKERSRAGKSVYNRRWTGTRGEYTPKYAEKVKGKTRPVDLHLSTEMMNAIKQIKSGNKKGEITIGFHRNKIERKAEGNIIGSYGRSPRIYPDKARPFLDILKKDYENIVYDVFREYEKDAKK